MAILPH